jgi:DNA-binding XRE family transcriptional regulator
MTVMLKAKRKRLEKAGWKVSTADDFLNLTAAESAYVGLKLTLSKNLQDRRRRKGLTQTELARVLKSSQSRIAKMEAGDPSVSIDLLVRSLIALGTPHKTLLRSLRS